MFVLETVMLETDQVNEVKLEIFVAFVTFVVVGSRHRGQATKTVVKTQNEAKCLSNPNRLNLLQQHQSLVAIVVHQKAKNVTGLVVRELVVLVVGVVVAVVTRSDSTC